MSRFLVHLEQRGEGCDYTISCGETIVRLPIGVTTMEEAIAYVNNSNPEDEKDGSLSSYCSEECMIESCTIYEIADTREIDVGEYYHKRAAASRAQDEAESKEARKAQLKKLKAEFGEE